MCSAGSYSLTQAMAASFGGNIHENRQKAGGSGTDLQDSPTSRLRQLKDLFDNDLIDRDTFEAKRNEIITSI